MHGCWDMDAPQHVLVGYDGSTWSELAIHRAFCMVEHSAFALIHIVAVVGAGPGDDVRLPSGELMSRWAALDSIRLMVATTTETSRTRFPQARVIAHLRTGDIAQSLVDFAYRFHVDQIVVGVRGQGTRQGNGVGSVATRILGLTEIPIHIEAPVSSMPPSSRSQTLRWAYVSDTRRGPATYLTHGKERALA